MPAAVVTFQGSPLTNGFVKGKYVCNATPAATNIVCGFIPSVVEGWNVTDLDQHWIWSSGAGAGKAMTVTTAAAAVATGGITAYESRAIDATDATTTAATTPVGAGFTIGVDAAIQEASKTFEFIAYR